MRDSLHNNFDQEDDELEQEPIQSTMFKPNNVLKKSSKNQNEHEKIPSSISSAFDQIGLYPNFLVGAAISPAIIPVDYYNEPSSTTKKPKSSKTSNRKPSGGKKRPKESERQVGPTSYTPTAQHNIGTHSNSIYSPNQFPSNNLAAYFNYLNTYSPNQNYQQHPNINGPPQYNGYLQQFSQPYGQTFDFFNNPFSNAYGPSHFNQGNQPNNGPNSFINSPFNGFNPSANGHISSQFMDKHIEVNERSEETEDEETPMWTPPRL